MKGGIIKKILAVSVTFLFLLTSISSVYAELDFQSKTLHEIISETELDYDLKLSNFYPNNKDLGELYHNPFLDRNCPNRKPTLLDGEDWDIIVPDDYSTIQQAIDQAEEGNHILVRSGIYEENVVIKTAGITVHGENAEITIVDGNYKDDVIEIQSDGVVISGFTIRNGGDVLGENYQAGIDIHANNTIITENEISNNMEYGIVLYHGENNLISRNLITANENDGLQLFSSTQNILSQNVVKQNGENDISLIDSHENKIRNNTIISEQLNGCYLSSSHKNIIKDNYIESSDKNALCITCSGLNNISSNKISTIGFAGIKIQYDSSSNIIESNHISSLQPFQSENGIFIFDSSQNRISNNSIYDHIIGLDIQKSSFICLQNNTIYNNTLGVCLTNTKKSNITNNLLHGNTRIGLELNSYCQHNQIINNTIFGEKQGDAIFITDYSDSNIIHKNTLEQNTDGIHIYLSNENRISHNHISNNAENGIYLVEAQRTHILSNNVCSNENHGMYIWHREFRNSYNFIINNTFFENAILIHNSFSNYVFNNTVDAKPLIYLENQHNLCIEHFSAGEIILIQCKNITICNQSIRNNDVAIILISSSNCVIKNNHFQDNKDALYLLYSINNIISFNNFINNNRDCYFIQWRNQSYSDFNSFTQNFWDSKNTLFHPLRGKKYIRILEVWWKSIPIICFDFSPAKEPYDMGD